MIAGKKKSCCDKEKSVSMKSLDYNYTKQMHKITEKVLKLIVHTFCFLFKFSDKTKKKILSFNYFVQYERREVLICRKSCKTENTKVQNFL